MRRLTKGTLIVATLAATALVGPQFSCRNAPQLAANDARRSTPSRYSFFPQPAFAQAASGQLARSASIADVAERVTASVVNIASVKVIHQHRSPYYSDPFFRHFFEDFFRRRSVPRERRQRSLGSGVIVSEEGIVLTNNHVVDKADEITVHLHDGRNVRAKVIGTDPKSDLAVLRLEGKPENLKALRFGDSDRLRLGDVVLAIGNPFGIGQTVTMGIVSAKGRANVGIVDYEDFIQTDAAINPGNSGGALVSLSGELVGINTAILSRSGGYQGIGFAIPSNMARAIEKSILAHGKVIRGWLGVSIQDLTQELAKALGVEGKKGVLIADVEAKSPAEKAGLQRGDLILSIGGKATISVSKLRNVVANAGANAKVTIKVLRKGQALTVEATLGELAKARGVAELKRNDGVLGGLTVGRLDAETRARFRLPERLRRGVVVLDVDDDSAAARAGLRVGDVLMEINRKPIDSVKTFTSTYQAATGQILLLVHRQGGTLYLLLRK